MRYLDIDDLWILDPTLYACMERLLDGFLVPMSEAADMRGFAANYFRMLEKQDFTSSGVPVLYSMISYPDEPVSTIRKVIDQARAAQQPGKPVYLFFGLNIWEMRPSHVKEALAFYEGEEWLRPVLLPQMFDLMVLYPPIDPVN